MSLNSSGAMIDVSKYKKIGEYRNGVMTWLSSDITNVVYLIMFGCESYIGSSINVHSRFQSFISSLKREKCVSMKVQNAFDKNCSFDLYAIEFTNSDNLREKEEFYINTMHPSLNTKTHADYLYRDSRPISQRKNKRDKKVQKLL